MARIARRHQIKQSFFFHVINRGILKQTIFHAPDDYSDFTRILQRYAGKADFSIYHWCLMPNHYHIVIECRHPDQLSKIIGGLQQVYAWKYHSRHDTVGRLFQNRFKSQAIEKESYLLKCGRYVERNPVRAGLATAAWEWPWSSAHFYTTGKLDMITTPDPLLKDKTWEDYKNWLADEPRDDLDLFRSTCTVIGGTQFKESFVIKKGRPIIDRRGKRYL
ncbi:MAG: transposase [Candidatus Aureabacteria bacterium]|nr:transposase [Candidatus Auribacterota bacterium]